MRRDDGLGGLYLPFWLAALAPASLCAVGSGAAGVWAVLAFLGLWVGFFLAALLVFALFLWICSLTVDRKAPPPEEDHPFYRRVVVYVLGLLCRGARLRLHVTGLEKLPAGRFLLVSNHRSGYDPIATVWALRRREAVAFITKPENLRIPIAGPMIYKANYLPIDRDDPRKAMKTIQRATALVKNDVVSVGVYPEGTRSRDGALGPFHSGVFKIAQKAGVPIVAAAIAGSEDIRRNFPLRHTDVYINICAVLEPDASGSCAAVSERARGLIEAALESRAGEENEKK